MGAVCVALVNEVMLAKTDATSLHNKLCCAAGLCHHIYSQLYNLSHACHRNRLMHIHMGPCDLAQRRSAVPVIGRQYKKRKLLLVPHTNVLLLLITLELLGGPIYLHYTLSTMAGFKERLPLNFEAPFCSFWDVTEVVDS